MKVVETPNIEMDYTHEEMVEAIRPRVKDILSNVVAIDKEQLVNTIAELVVNSFKTGINTGARVTLEAVGGQYKS